jgi:hypothetical protein
VHGFKNKEAGHLLGKFFPELKNAILLTRIGLGHILGDFFDKIIWSPC